MEWKTIPETYETVLTSSFHIGTHDKLKQTPTGKNFKIIHKMHKQACRRILKLNHPINVKILHAPTQQNKANYITMQHEKSIRTACYTFQCFPCYLSLYPFCSVTEQVLHFRKSNNPVKTIHHFGNWSIQNRCSVIWAKSVKITRHLKNTRYQ